MTQHPTTTQLERERQAGDVRRVASSDASAIVGGRCGGGVGRTPMRDALAGSARYPAAADRSATQGCASTFAWLGHTSFGVRKDDESVGAGTGAGGRTR